MMVVVVLPVGRFSSHSTFVASLSLGGEVVDMCNLIVSQRCTNQLPPPLLILMTFCSQMKIFPFSFCPFVDLFCTHFQILLKSMRNNLVYIITFSIPEYACTPFFDASFICVFTIMRPTDATNNYSTYLWCSSHLLWNVVCKTFFLKLSTWHFLFESVTSLKKMKKKTV